MATDNGFLFCDRFQPVISRELFFVFFPIYQGLHDATSFKNIIYIYVCILLTIMYAI